MTRKIAAVIDGKYRETLIDLGPRTTERHLPGVVAGVSAVTVAFDMHAARERRKTEANRAANRKRR